MKQKTTVSLQSRVINMRGSNVFSLSVAIAFGAAILFGLFYIWNYKLPNDSVIVIYFGRPSDILAYVVVERYILLASSFWCLFVAIVSLVLSGVLSVLLLVAGLLTDGRLGAIERVAAALQTVPVLVIVTISLLVETQLSNLLNITSSASWYCLLPVTIALMFPPLANGAGAMRRLPIHLKAMLRLWDAPSLWRIRRVYLPLAIPDILTGIRASATWAIGATLIAEGLLNGVNGDSSTLGHFLVRPFSSSVSPGRTPAVIIIATALGYLVYALFASIQRRIECQLRGATATAEAAYPLQFSRKTASGSRV